MHLRTLHLALFPTLFLSCSVLSLGADSVTGWITDRAHPDVQYRLKCTKGSLKIDWRNGYSGAVTMKVSVRGSDYDGDEQVVIPPGGSASSDVDTFGCYAPGFEIEEKKFSLGPSRPPAAPAKSLEPTATKLAPQAPTVAPWIPPAKLPEVAPEALTAIHVGMKQQEVLQKIGNPLSKIAIPEDNALVESYRYAVLSGKIGVIRFSNGVVTEVAVP